MSADRAGRHARSAGAVDTVEVRCAMGSVSNGLFATAVGLLISYGALRAVAAGNDEVRQAWVLHRHGRTATAVIVSLAEPDPESSRRSAVVRFDLAPAGTMRVVTQLPWTGRPELVRGAQVQVRYDPAAPTVVAPEGGRHQGRSEICQAVIVSALVLLMVLPTSEYLIYACPHTLLLTGPGRPGPRFDGPSTNVRDTPARLATLGS